MTKIAVFNLGISNLTSVTNVLDYVGAKYYLVENVADLKGVEKMLLPGVGTFDAGMRALQGKNLVPEIRKQVLQNKIPFFGICLGMQLLFENSEESPSVEGLGLLQGQIVRVPAHKNYQIPRIGWADSLVKKDFLGLKKDDKSDFYYIHSYHANPLEKEIIAITSQDDLLVGAVSKDNIFGCQFHPEKSYIDGVKLIKNFVQL